MKDKNFVTVFTPTFNRADKLVRVYRSLEKQTYRNFEWLIIDDGSDDDTRHVVDTWVAEQKVKIRYVWQKNRGKFWSIWEGVKRAKGDWFLIADSDDEFIPETIEIFLDYWKQLNIDVRSLVCGISGLCCWNDTGDVMGNPFPESPMISDTLEITYGYRAIGEKWGILRTDKLREFFPHGVPDGVRFISESYIWYQMALKYKTVYINKVMRICYRSYREGGGLTANFMTEKYPMGMYLSENMNFICMRKYYFGNWKLTVITAVKLIYASRRANVDMLDLMREKTFGQRIFLLMAYPIGVGMGIVRRLQYKNRGRAADENG